MTGSSSDNVRGKISLKGGVMAGSSSNNVLINPNQNQTMLRKKQYSLIEIHVIYPKHMDEKRKNLGD